LADLDNDVTTEVIEVLPEEKRSVCLFIVGKGTYAIPVDLLTEIILSQKIFAVPSAPSHVPGVINLRGNIVPIVDIRPALSLPQTSLPGQIVIVKHGTTALGSVVDNVYDVVGVPESSVQAIPREYGMPQAGRNLNSFLPGIIQRKTGAAALLNLERVFDEIKLN
jgi:purine-binding chemotaxis protein CheW